MHQVRSRDLVAQPLWMGRNSLVLAVVACLLAFAAANISLRASWHEVEDGVLWTARPEGVVAAEVSPGSAAAAVGIAPGDVLQKPENVSVRDGVLHLLLKKEAAGGKNYTGAETISREEFKYGYFEARMKMPSGAGWHTSFWLQKHDGSGTTDSQDALQGLDVGQNDSIDPLTYTVTLNKYNPEPPANYGYQRLAAPDLSADFHVFGCEFTPEAARFYLDGKLVLTVSASAIQHGEQNLWVTSIASHMGGTRQVDESALPQEALCDYVRVFTRPTPAASPGSP